MDFFAEKTRSYDARTQDMINEIYKNWKKLNGFSDAEINNKETSLKGELDPFSSRGNFKMLKRAGFKDIGIVSKPTYLETILAIK